MRPQKSGFVQTACRQGIDANLLKCLRNQEHIVPVSVGLNRRYYLLILACKLLHVTQIVRECSKIYFGVVGRL